MQTEIPKVEKKKCPACAGSGLLDVPHIMPFSEPLFEPESCPVCNGLGEIEKKQKNYKKNISTEHRLWVCLKIRHLKLGKNPLMSDCTRTECVFYRYCIEYLKINKNERHKLSGSEAFKRARCFFYQWQCHGCTKKEISTNRIICAMCPYHTERSRWQITLHLTVV